MSRLRRIRAIVFFIGLQMILGMVPVQATDLVFYAGDNNPNLVTGYDPAQSQSANQTAQDLVDMRNLVLDLDPEWNSYHPSDMALGVSPDGRIRISLGTREVGVQNPDGTRSRVKLYDVLNYVDNGTQEPDQMKFLSSILVNAAPGAKSVIDSVRFTQNSKFVVVKYHDTVSGKYGLTVFHGGEAVLCEDFSDRISEGADFLIQGITSDTVTVMYGSTGGYQSFLFDGPGSTGHSDPWVRNTYSAQDIILAASPDGVKKISLGWREVTLNKPDGSTIKVRLYDVLNHVQVQAGRSLLISKTPVSSKPGVYSVIDDVQYTSDGKHVVVKYRDFVTGGGYGLVVFNGDGSAVRADFSDQLSNSGDFSVLETGVDFVTIEYKSKPGSRETLLFGNIIGRVHATNPRGDTRIILGQRPSGENPSLIVSSVIIQNTKTGIYRETVLSISGTSGVKQAVFEAKFSPDGRQIFVGTTERVGNASEQGLRNNYYLFSESGYLSIDFSKEVGNKDIKILKVTFTNTSLLITYSKWWIEAGRFINDNPVSKVFDTTVYGRIFRLVDTDRNGKVDATEMYGQILATTLGIGKSTLEMDVDLDGYITSADARLLTDFSRRGFLSAQDYRILQALEAINSDKKTAVLLGGAYVPSYTAKGAIGYLQGIVDRYGLFPGLLENRAYDLNGDGRIDSGDFKMATNLAYSILGASEKTLLNRMSVGEAKRDDRGRISTVWFYNVLTGKVDQFAYYSYVGRSAMPDRVFYKTAFGQMIRTEYYDAGGSLIKTTPY